MTIFLITQTTSDGYESCNTVNGMSDSLDKAKGRAVEMSDSSDKSRGPHCYIDVCVEEWDFECTEPLKLHQWCYKTREWVDNAGNVET